MDPFKTWLRKCGIDPDAERSPETNAGLQKMYETYQEAERRAQQTPPANPGTTAPAPVKPDPTERMTLILGTARAAIGTAAVEMRAAILDFATELVGKPEVTAVEAQRQIAAKVVELAAKPPSNPAADPNQRTETDFAAPRDPNALLSKRDIVAAFGQERDNRGIYALAARSVLGHIEAGNAIPSAELFAGLKDKRGLMVIHEETGDRPVRRTVTAASENVAVQVLLTILLNKVYAERPPVTDNLVTVIPGGAAEFTLPEVETENGVKQILEGQPYPMLGGAGRTVKTSHVKYGGALAQTRENSVFDQLGRVMVHLRSMARQLRRHRDNYRLARICDSTGLDGRYIARPGDDNGSAVLYTETADHRGNHNLVTSNALADETDIAADITHLEAMKLLDGTYVVPELKVVLVPSGLKATAWKILHSLFCPSAVAATGQPLLPNPYGPGGMLSEVPQVISHPAVETYSGLSTTWFAGDPKQQFYEIEHWPTEVVPVLVAGDMLLRDIVQAWKGSFCIDLVALTNMFFLKNTA